MPYVRRIGGTMTAPTEVKIGTEVKKYVRDIISRGDCPLFFPMSEVREANAPEDGNDGGKKDDGGVIKAYFYTDGYMPLKDVRIDSPFTGARILAALVRGAQNGENYYVTPCDYVLNEETVFVKMRGEEPRIKMIFRPANPEKRERNQWEYIADYLLGEPLREYPEYMREVRAILSSPAAYRNAWRRLELFKRKMYAL